MKKSLTKLRSFLRKILGSIAERIVVSRFHKIYYNSGVWKRTSWLGVQILKCPLDLWVYQEIICELQPDVIIETGTAHGGGALYLASLCELIGKGEVVTIDIAPRENRPKHDRITYLTGSCISNEIVETIKSLIKNKNRVMVILDSDHNKDHVLLELKIYSNIVTKGSYLIVEDTNINGHPVRPDFGPGPLEAVNEFLKYSKNFRIDTTKEKFYLTFNPQGFLRKIE